MLEACPHWQRSGRMRSQRVLGATSASQEGHRIRPPEFMSASMKALQPAVIRPSRQPMAAMMRSSGCTKLSWSFERWKRKSHLLRPTPGFSSFSGKMVIDHRILHNSCACCRGFKRFGSWLHRNCRFFRAPGERHANCVSGFAGRPIARAFIPAQNLVIGKQSDNEED